MSEKQFRITYEESFFYQEHIQAECKAEAIDKFKHMLENDHISPLQEEVKEFSVEEVNSDLVY